MSLQLIFDSAQSRIKVNRNVVLAQGSWPGRNNDRVSGWSTLSTNCYRDPVCFVGMLHAYQLQTAWFTTTTGNYARMRLSDFTHTAASWYELEQNISGDYWFNHKTGHEAIITTATWTKNRAWMVGLFGYNSGNDVFEQCRFGHSNTAGDTAGLHYRYFSDGTIQVWKNSAIVGEGSIAGTGPRAVQAGERVYIYVIPFRKRELLIFSDHGAGFTCILPDVDEDDPDPAITPATKFWIDTPAGRSQVQVHVLSYPTTGTLISRQLGFGKAPATGATLGTPEVFHDRQYSSAAGSEPAPVVTVVETDGTTAFVANGVRKDCMVKFAITGDGTGTPFIYGGLAGYGYEAADTDGSEEIDITEHVEMVRLDVPEDPSGISIAFMLRRSAGIGQQELIERMGNRPIKLLYAGNCLFNGRTFPPETDEGISDEATHVEFEASAWKGLEQYRFPDVVPLDGRLLEQGLDFFLTHARLNRHADSSDLDLTLPQAYGEAAGNWNLATDVGDTSAWWMDRLVDDFAPHCRTTLRPLAFDVPPEWWIKDPIDIDAQDVRATIYGTIQEAIDEGGFTGGTEASRHVWKKYRERPIEAESNSVRVTGWDPRERRPIQSLKEDDASLTVDTPPSARPENWLGEPRLYGLVDTAITTQALCDEVTERLYQRLTPLRRMAEIEADMQSGPDSIPIWPGDLIELFGKGIYIVHSLSIDFVKIPGGLDTWQSLPGIYCLEYLKEA